MEVNVLRHGRIPEGSVLSIRAGNVRRQAPVASGRPFKFPGKLENPLKVDILQQVATGHVIVRPGEQQYKVVFLEDPLMHCEVEIRPSDSAGSRMARMEGEDGDRNRQGDASATSAKDYLEQHAVLEFIQAVLQTVIRDKPADPFSAMARHFSSGYSGPEERERLAGSANSAGSQMAAPPPSPPPGRPLKMPPPSAPSEQPPALPPAGPTSEEWAALHDQRARLTEERVQLEVARAELAAERERMEAERQIASLESTALPRAMAANGSGASTMRQSPEDVRNALRATLESCCQSGELERAMQTAKAKKEAQSPEMRSSLKNTIMSSCESGDLARALEIVKTRKQAQKVDEGADLRIAQRSTLDKSSNSTNSGVGIVKAGQRAQKEDEGADLRIALRSSLEKSSDSGDLARAFETLQIRKQGSNESDNGKPENMKRLLREAFELSYKSGQLNEVLGNILDPQKPSAEFLRISLKASLERSCASGELDRAIENIQAANQEQSPQQLDELRGSLRGLLEGACESGDLRRSIEKMMGDQESKRLLDLRSTLRDKLAEACATGDFIRALTVAKATDLDNTRASLKDALTQSCETGDLVKALQGAKSQVQPVETEEETRRALKSKLQQSCESGELLKALSHVKSGRVPKPCEETPEDLRKALKSTLQGACESGLLHRAMETVKATSIESRQNEASGTEEQLRSELKDALQSSTENFIQMRISSGQLSQAQEAKAPQEESPDAMRLALKETLQRGVVSGELSRALVAVSGAKADTKQREVADILKPQIRFALETSLQSGELERAMAVAIQEKSSGNGKTGQADTKQREVADTLKPKIRFALETSLQSGELERAMAVAIQEKSSDNGKLQLALLSATAQPGLAERRCLSDSDLANGSRVRKDIMQALQESLHSGDLEVALQSLKPGGPADALRSRLKQTLEESCKSGELLRALEAANADENGGKGAPEADVAQAKQNAFLALTTALKDGASGVSICASLTEMELAQAKQDTLKAITDALTSDEMTESELAQAKQSTFEAMTNALAITNAPLSDEQAIFKARTAEALKGALLAPQGDHSWQKQEEMERARVNVRGLFENAYESGQLTQALAQVAQPAEKSFEGEAVKGRMRDLFAQASESGELDRALLKLRDERGSKSEMGSPPKY